MSELAHPGDFCPNLECLDYGKLQSKSQTNIIKLATGQFAHQAPLSVSLLVLRVNTSSQDLSAGCQIGFGELGTTDLRQFQHCLNDEKYQKA